MADKPPNTKQGSIKMKKIATLCTLLFLQAMCVKKSQLAENLAMNGASVEEQQNILNNFEERMQGRAGPPSKLFFQMTCENGAQAYFLTGYGPTVNVRFIIQKNGQVKVLEETGLSCPFPEGCIWTHTSFENAYYRLHFASGPDYENWDGSTHPATHLGGVCYTQ